MRPAALLQLRRVAQLSYVAVRLSHRMRHEPRTPSQGWRGVHFVNHAQSQRGNVNADEPAAFQAVCAAAAAAAALKTHSLALRSP